MSKFKTPPFKKSAQHIAMASALFGAVALAPTSVSAFSFDPDKLKLGIDTTVSWGLSVRAEERDPMMIAIGTNAELFGTEISATQRPIGMRSSNGDDGTVNYDQWDIFSNTVKVTSEMLLDYGNYGAFARGSAAYDFHVMNADFLSDSVRQLAGRTVDLLDAYVYGSWDVGDRNISARIGNQVLSWGESTFIFNGLNIINPLDITKFRKPGAEIKEGLLPVPMVWASMDLTDTLSIEAFYQFRFEPVIIDGHGTYFSSTDPVGDAHVPEWNPLFRDLSEAERQRVLDYQAAQIAANPNFVPYVADPTTGAAITDVNTLSVGAHEVLVRDYDDTQPARINGHANPKEPNRFYFGSELLSQSQSAGETPAAVDANGNPVAYAKQGNGRGSYSRRGPNELARNNGQWGISLRYYAEQLNDTEFGFYYINNHSWLPIFYLQAPTAGSTSNNLRHGLYYPESIRTWGVSFNTTLNSIGVALQGEYSYKENQPVQLATRELFYYALTPIWGFDAVPNQFSEYAKKYPNGGEYGGDDGAFGSQGIALDGNQVLHGAMRLPYHQAQMTFTKAFGPANPFGASQWVLLGEAGVSYVGDMPSNEEFYFNSGGTTNGNGPVSPTGRNCFFNGTLVNNPKHPYYNKFGQVSDNGVACTNANNNDAGGFGTQFSWGYRLITKLNYSNVIGAWNMSPSLRFSHDVKGYTPAPMGNFVQDRKAVSLALTTDYLSRYSATVSYTTFFGGGIHNKATDKDFLSINAKYSF